MSDHSLHSLSMVVLRTNMKR